MTTQASQIPHVLQWPAITAALAAAGSTAVAALLFPVVATTGYAWALTACIAAGAAPIAVIDARTRRLPNRYTSAIAAAGLIQAVAISIGIHNPMRILDTLIAAAAVGAVYVVLGLAGWFGFGDVKFAAALTIPVAIYAGLAAIYLVPLAVLFAAVWMLLSRAAGRAGLARAHGPAIALAAVCIMTAAVLTLPRAG